MKIHKLLPFIVILAFGAGCGSVLTKGQPKTVSTVQPVYSYDAKTGQIFQSGTTQINTVATPYEVNTNLLAGIQAAQTILGAGASVPSPASPFLYGAGAILAGISGLLGIYAKKKSGELTTSNAALAATITAIETAQQADAIKKAVQAHAVANGSQDYLDGKVQEISFNTPKS